MALVKKYTIEVNGQQAVASVGQIRDEVKRLEAELDKTVSGTREAEAALFSLGRAKAAIVEIEDSIDGLQLKNRGAVFADFADGVVGSFGVIAIASKNLGLADISNYEQKLQEVLAITSSFEAIQRGLNGETIAGVKNQLQLAKAYLFGGQAATSAGRAARVALAATGIGLLIVGVGLLIANFDKVKASVSGLPQLFDKVKAVASGTLDAIIGGVKTISQVIDLAVSGDFSGAVKKARTVGAVIGKAYAVGYQESVEATAKEAADKLLRLTIDSNKRLIAEQEAAGRDTYALKRKTLQQELKLIEQNSDEEKKAHADKLSEIRVLDAQHYKKVADERKAANEKKQQENFAAHQQELTDLGGQQLETIEVVRTRQKELADAVANGYANAFNIRRAGAALPEAVEGVLIEAEDVVDEKLPSITDKIMVGLFGVKPEDLEKVKTLISDTFTALAETVGSISNVLLESATADADAALEVAQARFDQADQRLSEARARREADEAKLATASGARRDFLLKRIESERKAEQKLAAEKAQAAAEQAKAERERQKLMKVSQQVSLALAGAAAVEAGVKAVSSASALPFPANIPAMITALAAVVGVVASARGLAKTFRNGGQVGLISGPSHEAGGIQMWHKSGAHLGEMEGGEYVVNKWATRAFLPELERMNKAGQMRVLSPPSGMYANGGIVGTPSSLPPGTVAVRVVELEELLAYARATATNTGATAGNTAQIAAHGPARLQIGEREAVDIDALRKRAMQMEIDNSLGVSDASKSFSGRFKYL
ncbi:hypothetical protein HER32_14280 [Hymenobacter sp. BT18]|uniref:hypothetical protein n=1 Tax=Hymenobacter sp. BT18 TaxID=2835648 RepID=UPI00143E8397|nr:hypothetical protein [Hymenobacter sp. BT18]QIX62281.1 hypothetical protein HER32_14280 [Hymenobacter sp. BT18]